MFSELGYCEKKSRTLKITKIIRRNTTLVLRFTTLLTLNVENI